MSTISTASPAAPRRIVALVGAPSAVRPHLDGKGQPVISHGQGASKGVALQCADAVIATRTGGTLPVLVVGTDKQFASWGKTHVEASESKQRPGTLAFSPCVGNVVTLSDI